MSGDFAQNLQKGERVARQCGDIRATKWKDKRDVITLSTVDADVMIDTTNPRSRFHDHQVMKPQTVLTYNSNKAGVDKHDQMASYYPMCRKSLKWWKKLFFWLYVMGVVNSFKLCKFSNPTSKLRLSQYIITLAKKLLKEAGIEERNQPPNAAAEPRRHVTGNHFPIIADNL